MNINTNDSSGVTIAGLMYEDTSYNSNLGPLRLLVNQGPGPVVLSHFNSGNSNVQDKLYFATGADVTLAVNESILLWHGTHTNYWHPIGRWQDLAIAPRVVPSALTSSTRQDNWDPGNGFHGYRHLALQTSSTGTATLTGIAEGVDGEEHELCNYGNGEIDINNADSNSTAHDRFWNFAGATIKLPATGGTQVKSCVGIRYDISNHVWIELWGPQSTTPVDWTMGTSSTLAIESVAAPTVNHGTLAGSSTNFVGRVTSVGTNTSVTLTFGNSGFGTTAFCFAQVEGSAQGIYVTASATAPVFNCFNTTTAAAANCNNFSYQCIGH